MYTYMLYVGEYCIHTHSNVYMLFTNAKKNFFLTRYVHTTFIYSRFKQMKKYNRL